MGRPDAARTIALRCTTIIVIFAALCTLFVAASRGYFRADDFGHLQIVKFGVMRNPATIITEFSNAGHYRPMEKAFYWITYLVFGLDPLGYFVVLITMFLLTVYVFFLLAKALSGNVLSAYAAVSLLLLQGNLYLYTVNWIATATDILAGLFAIVMLFSYIQSTMAVHRAKLYYLLSLISFGFGLLSREIIIVMVPILLVYDFLFLWSETLEKRGVLKKRFFSHVPFWVVLVGYVLARSAVPKTRGLLGGGGYTFVLGSNVLDNLVFYGMQFGFLPMVICFSSIPALVFDKVKLAKRDLKLMALGLSLATCAILPFLFFKWSSPTWTYLPAFGTTFAFSILFVRVFSDSTRKKVALLLYGTLVSALFGNFLLFSKLNEARWWRWGTYSRNVIEQVEAYYPTLPSGTTLYFIDRDNQEPYGIEALFRFQPYLSGAFRVWYNDPSLRAYMVDEVSSVESAFSEKEDEEASSILVFEYDEGSLIDKTEYFEGRESN